MCVFGRYAGILSAYGMALADVVYEAQEPCAKVYNPGNAGPYTQNSVTFYLTWTKDFGEFFLSSFHLFSVIGTIAVIAILYVC